MLGFGQGKKLIGHFLVPIITISKLYAYPQYFGIVDQNQAIQGKLLARFYLIPKSVDKAAEKEK